MVKKQTEAPTEESRQPNQLEEPHHEDLTDRPTLPVVNCPVNTNPTGVDEDDAESQMSDEQMSDEQPQAKTPTRPDTVPINITVTSLKVEGIRSNSPYMCELLNSKESIVCLQEHQLFSYDKAFLNQLFPSQSIAAKSITT